MLILASDLKQKTIFSLETGEVVATVNEPIIDPNSLKVVAFKLNVLDDPIPRVVFTDDIRESDLESFSVDGYKNLVELDSHLVRLQKIIALNFDIFELKVEDSGGKKLGDITDYVVNDSNFELNRFYYRTKDIKGRLLNQNKFFARASINKLSNKRIIIN
jgi:sporulation protein YlmC with PRC-barrel domain